MSVRKSIEKLKSFEQEFQDFEQNLLEEFPGSQTMLEFSTDFGILAQSLREFREALEAEVNQAGLETDMKKDLMSKIKEHEIFGKLSEENQSRLAEYLLTSKTALWTPEEFIQYIVDKLKVKTPEDIIADLPQYFIKNIGRKSQQTEGDGEKTLYMLGVETLQKVLLDPEQKGIFLKEYATDVVEKAPLKALLYVFDNLGSGEEL